MTIARILSVSIMFGVGVVAGGLLSGCGLANKVQTRADYRQSAANFKQCVVLKGADNCRDEYAIMVTDRDAFAHATKATESRVGVSYIYLGR